MRSVVVCQSEDPCGGDEGPLRGPPGPGEGGREWGRPTDRGLRGDLLPSCLISASR